MFWGNPFIHCSKNEQEVGSNTSSHEGKKSLYDVPVQNLSTEDQEPGKLEQSIRKLRLKISKVIGKQEEHVRSWVNGALKLESSTVKNIENYKIPIDSRAVYPALIITSITIGVIATRRSGLLMRLTGPPILGAITAAYLYPKDLNNYIKKMENSCDLKNITSYTDPEKIKKILKSLTNPKSNSPES